MATLGDLAQVLRSKNAGPFQITIDLMFADAATYSQVRDGSVLTPDVVAALYGIRPAQVRIICFDRVRAIKVTLPRLSGARGSGSAFDRDVYGAQQHGPLSDLEVAEAKPRRA